MKHRLQNSEFFEQEASRLAEAYPKLTLQRSDKGWYIVLGTMEIVSEVSYSIRLLIPPKYPDEAPILRCDAREIPWDLDRHVYLKNGIACLCVAGELRIHWPLGSDLRDFLDKLVKPFLVGQFYFNKHGCWPDTGQRDHGPAGIIQAYSEILSEIPNITEQQIQRFLVILSRKNHPGGHELCPCGSGQRLRHCHRDMVLRFRQKISIDHAAFDLSILQKASYDMNYTTSFI